MNDPVERRNELMRVEAKLQRAFRHFLIAERGFPDEAISLEASLPGRVRVDLLLLDPITRKYLGIIEFRVVREAFEKNRRNYLSQLLVYQAAVRDLQLPVFLVMPASIGERVFDIWRPDDDNGLEEVTTKDFPTFEALRSLIAARDLEQTRAAQVTSVKSVSSVSVLLALLVGVLLMTAVADLWKPTWEKLSLTAGFIGLLLFPEVRKLKIAGLEFERNAADASLRIGSHVKED